MDNLGVIDYLDKKKVKFNSCSGLKEVDIQSNLVIRNVLIRNKLIVL